MNPFAKWFLILGSILTLGGPALGAVGTVIGMMGTFRTLGKEGVVGPESLAAQVHFSLISMAAGLVVAGVGVFLLVSGFIILMATKQKSAPPPLPGR